VITPSNIPPELGPVTFRIDVHHDLVCLSEQDYDFGIPIEDQSRVFEPSFLVDPFRTRNTGGYGLGDSLLKKILTEHGGEVVLTSSSNDGSTFILKIQIPENDGSPGGGEHTSLV
jgi:signal transduction histidine kinase